jgi:hypothetical protein
MNKRILSMILIAGLALAACSETDALLNVDSVIAAMTNCFEPTWEGQVDPLLDLVLAIFSRAEDVPPGTVTVVDSQNTFCEITATVGLATLDMTISYYDPSGGTFTTVFPDPEQGVPVDQADIDSILDSVATDMGDNNPGTLPYPNPPTQRPFLCATFTLSGGGVTGSGTFVGVIGGAASDDTQNETQEIRTVVGNASGAGIPANGTVMIDTGGCSITFGIVSGTYVNGTAAGPTLGLVTDQVDDEQNQTLPEEYPNGLLTFTVTSGSDSATGSIVFNGPANSIANIEVNGLLGLGTATLNIDTGDVTLDF